MQIDIKTIISFLAVAFSNIKGNAEPREAIGASVRIQVKIVFPFLLQIAPFVNLSVDTFPDKRGQLFV
ncbi:MAG: hypothetical protein E6293_08485 [Dialister sp.]|nr:hypothetical protein [Dialister sp.]